MSKLLSCDKCNKIIEVGKFAKSKISCECGGILSRPNGQAPVANQLKVDDNLGSIEDIEYFKKRMISSIPKKPSIEELPITTDQLKITIDKSNVEPTRQPILFIKGQKVRVIEHEFIIFGVKGKENGFLATIERDLGFDQKYQDNVIQVRNCGNGKVNNGHGVYNILSKFIIIDDW